MAFVQKHYTYSPEDIELTISGVSFNEGLSENGVTVSRNEDVATHQTGILGDVTINKSLNRTGTLTISLLAQSIYDQTLDALIDQEEIYAVPVELKVRPTNKVYNTVAWYMTQPDFAAAGEVAVRDHVFTLQDSTPRTIGDLPELLSSIRAATS